MYLLAKLLKAIHSDASPWQLALGLMLGMIVGLTPMFRLHNLILLFILLLFRINLGAFLVSLAVFSILAFILDPVMIHIGEMALASPALTEFWTALYNTGIGRLSQFYHTLTMGSLILSLVLSPVLLFVSKYLIISYREHVMEWVDKLKIMQALKGSRLYQVYQTVGG